MRLAVLASSARDGGVEGGSDASETCVGVRRPCEEGDAADMAEARRVALVEADDVVESSGNSTISQVCSVASGAKDTRRLASDFRRASLRSRISFFSISRLSLSSRSLAAACCSSSVLNGTLVLPSRSWSRAADVSKGFERPLMVYRVADRSFFPGDMRLLFGLRLPARSGGITLGGDNGILGLRIDFMKGITADYPGNVSI